MLNKTGIIIEVLDNKGWRVKKVEKICLNCLGSFHANYYDHVKGRGNFCKKSCHHEYLRSKALSTGSRLEKKCQQCNNPFTVNAGEITKGGGKYCSPKCVTDYNTGENNHAYKPKLQKTCKECNNSYEVYPSQQDNQYCSRSCASVNFYRKNNQVNKGVQRGKGGKREDLNGLYVRSSWEANYARYLNFLVKQGEIEKWEYEVDTFEFIGIKRGVRFYTPDFKVFSNDSFEYHEVKGWMDKKSITRHKRMDKYYPNVKIRIIDKAWFRSNGRNLSGVVPNWEKGT